jgi:hypothetical protein
MIIHVITMDLPMRVFLGSEFADGARRAAQLHVHLVCASFVSVRAEILQNGC